VPAAETAGSPLRNRIPSPSPFSSMNSTPLEACSNHVAEVVAEGFAARVGYLDGPAGLFDRLGWLDRLQALR
jgi:hypothetical protein